MKKFKLIFAAVLTMAAISLGSTSVYAQEDNNRDANGYVVRGPYLTNGGGANWFIGLGGGVNTSVAKGVVPFRDFSLANNWGAEAFLGKWFTPTVGARVGYKGVMNNFGYDTKSYFSENYPSGEQVRFGYVHGDFMWNLSNALGGYKETRFWDIIPYVGGGYLGINNGTTDNKFACSAGIFNEFRLGKTVNLFVDVNVIGTENPLKMHKVLEDGSVDPIDPRDNPVLTHPLYIPTATVGFTFNIGRKKNFDRFSSVGVSKSEYNKLSEANKALHEQKGALESENSVLRKQLAECQSRPLGTKQVVVEKTRVLTGSTVITFAINSSKLSKAERDKVVMFAKSFAESDSLVKVLGSADSKTGSERRNKDLSAKRAEVVRDVLVKNGIAAERITIESTIDATETPETSRSAILTLSAE